MTLDCPEGSSCIEFAQPPHSRAGEPKHPIVGAPERRRHKGPLSVRHAERYDCGSSFALRTVRTRGLSSDCERANGTPEIRAAPADAPPNRRRRKHSPGWRSVRLGSRVVGSSVTGGGARSTRSADAARLSRIARIAAGSSMVPSKRRRPPQRGQASTSMSKARRMRFAHAQCRGCGGGACAPASSSRFVGISAIPGGGP